MMTASGEESHSITGWVGLLVKREQPARLKEADTMSRIKSNPLK
jgi:hypothetical protein